MKTTIDITDNESGFVLVIACMILILVTIIGIAAVTTTTTELNIAANEKKAEQNFYNADAALRIVAALAKNNLNNEHYLETMTQPRLIQDCNVSPLDLNSTTVWAEKDPKHQDGQHFILHVQSQYLGANITLEAGYEIVKHQN